MSLSGPELPAKSHKDKTEGCTQLPSKTLHSFFIDTHVVLEQSLQIQRGGLRKAALCAERQLVTSSGCKESTGKLKILVVGKT